LAFQNLAERRYGELLKHLPVIDLDVKVLGKKNAFWRKWIAHPVNDSYWKRASFSHKLKRVNIPVFHQSGWFDGDGIGSKLNYAQMRKHKHRYQKLVLGPWGHTARSTRRHRGRDFGPRALMDLQRLYLRWFDRWLKGVNNGIDKEPLVQIFVMGTNAWLKGNTYPLKGTKMEKWYLASGSKANTAHGDGVLSRKRPTRRAKPDRYVYDPGDPTPDPRYWMPPKPKKGQILSGDKLKAAAEKHHARVTAKRQDILVYTTPPLVQRYTFAGPLSAVIYAATTAKDTDWFVRLCEVDAKGKIFVLVQGKIRARFRRSMSRPTLLKKNRVYKYKLDLWQTGITIAKGARLRVEIASAAFPFFSRNLNTGGHNETETRFVKATQTIHHSRRYPSHILLPAIPTARVNRAAAAVNPTPPRGSHNR
jgi:putative CocE/NonD family hydrolase